MYTHTTVFLLFWNMSRTTRVSRYQKGKIRKAKANLDLLEQEIVSGSGISWAICKSAPHPRQPRNIPPLSFFTGRMPFLLPNQQHQSTVMYIWEKTAVVLDLWIMCSAEFTAFAVVFNWVKFKSKEACFNSYRCYEAALLCQIRSTWPTLTGWVPCVCRSVHW